jgi:putative sigma-54 modulation protein
MNINIKATGIELTPAIEDYAQKKVSALDKYLKNPESHIARVEIGRTTRHHKEGAIFRAEIHISGGIDIYAAREAEDLYAAIDMMEAEAARELQSTKGKRFKLLRRGQKAFKDAVRGIGNKFKRD